MENVKNDSTKKHLFESPRVYLDQLLIVDELYDFKRQLLSDIKTNLKEQIEQPTKKCVKSKNVRKLLAISPGNLQSLRMKGILLYKRVGGLIYPDSEEIQKMLDTKNQYSVHP